MAEQAKKPEGGVELSIQDIVLSANIIDLATQRGAFKAAEAAQVGASFEKLVAFIKANTPQPEPEEDKADNKKDAKSSKSKEK
tara:strand:- start:233 stop:481 length:249 start_codon:yes stop_codon:yes gene_type:complete